MVDIVGISPRPARVCSAVITCLSMATDLLPVSLNVPKSEAQMVLEGHAFDIRNGTEAVAVVCRPCTS